MTPDPGDTDIASRLVGFIKSATEISTGNSNAPGATQRHRMAQPGIAASPRLRVLFAAIAAIMLALWGWHLVPAIQNWNNPNEDGFSLIPGSLTTITLLPLGLFALIGAISGRGKHVANARLACMIGSDLLVLGLALEILRRRSNAMPG
jgi:hypothetical protein